MFITLSDAIVHVQVNTVRAPPGAESWTQRVMSAFVQLREFAAKQQQQGVAAILPIAIQASTRGTAASLSATASGLSRVKDINLQLLSHGEMEEVVLDVIKRLPTPPATVQLPEGLSEMLQWVGGNPRLLARTMSALSGSRSLIDETLQLGASVGNPSQQ